MQRQLLIYGLATLVITAGSQTVRAQGDDKAQAAGKDAATKVYEVGAGLKINGELGKVQAITYRVKLEAGKTYVIDMMSPNPNALDPLLRLLDASGNQLVKDDDSGGGLNSRILFRTEVASIHQIQATRVGKGDGPFHLTVYDAHNGNKQQLAERKVKPVTQEQQFRLREADRMELKVALFYKQRQFRQAVPLAEQIVSIRRDILGEYHVQYAMSLHNLASQYQGLNELDKAEPLYIRALEIKKTVFGEKDADYATSISNLAFLYESQRHYSKAELLFRQALELRRELVGENHADFASSLNNLATLYRLQVRDDKALPLFIQALEIRKEVLGEKHPKYALSLNNLAGLYGSQGDYAKAESLYRKSLEIKKEVLGEKHPDYALSLRNLAATYNNQGILAKAEALYQKDLEIIREVLGETHADYATSLNNLGFMYCSHGNHAKGATLYRQALTIRGNVLGTKHPHYAISLNNLAVTLAWQGNYSAAESLLHEALEIRRATLGEKHPDVGHSLHNLASVYERQGDSTRAEVLYREAIAILRQSLGEKHPDHASSLNNLAMCYLRQGKHAASKKLFEESVAIRREALGSRHSEFALSLSRLAYLHNLQGHLERAESLCREAFDVLQLAENARPIDSLDLDDLLIHIDCVEVLRIHSLVMRNSAAVKPTVSKLRSCNHSYHLALSMLDRLRQKTMDQEDSKIQLTGMSYELFPERIGVLNGLFSLEQDSRRLTAAFRTAEQGTARVFLEAIGSNKANLIVGVNVEIQSEERQLLQTIHSLDTRIVKESAKPLDTRVPDALARLFGERRRNDGKLRELTDRLEKDYPQYAGLKYPRPCKLDDARKCLAPNEIALLFVPGSEASYIVLVDSRSKPDEKANGLAIIEIPNSTTLAEHVAALADRETLASAARVQALGREAFDAILGPCKDRIHGKNLVIVPLDSLCQLPFELLVEPDGKFLVEKHRIRYAPSLTALHLINLWKQKRAEPTLPFFAVGDPLYETGTQVAAAGTSDALRELAWREGNSESFTRLVHSGKEVAEIAGFFGADSKTVFTGADATEAKVKAASKFELLSKARYVHFATHGILGVDRGKQPALVLNLVGNSSEDGFLHLDEITNLKLNADLVVLSACRTGQGRMARGEGVTGLARAFLYAGSKGVVCSLWSVDDRETSNLMVDFYGHLKKGRSASEALRESQLSMIRAGKAPLYWAPFILIGE